MKSLYRWVFEHTGLCRTLLFLVLCAFAFYAASFEYVSFLGIYLMVLAVWFLVGRFIASAPAKLLQEPIAQLRENCDPYPMMEEIGHQLERKFEGPHRQMLEVNYAVALRETGQYEKALALLEDLNIDKFPGTAPFSKYAYYHNLCDLCYLLERQEEGRIWYRKCCQIYRDLPPTNVKQELSFFSELMEAEYLYYEGNPESALRKVAWIQLPTRSMAVSGALLAARCHIALEEPEKAREKLQYVIDNGNRLIAVQQAREILEDLN